MEIHRRNYTEKDNIISYTHYKQIYNLHFVRQALTVIR